MFIHHSVEAHAQNFPTKVAIRFESQSMQYQELNEEANRIAHYLLSQNVQPGSLVGLSLERSPRLIVAMLALLKIGAAYVPLDIKNPTTRNLLILNNAKISHLLLDDETQSHFSQYDCIKYNYATMTSNAQAYPKSNPDIALSPSNTAYVIYTSGTTGQPNGVVIPHENVMDLLHVTQPIYQLNSDDIWTCFHSYAFDFSVWEIWGALVHGATLVVVPSNISAAPHDFYNLLIHEKVTVLNVTPSAFYPLIRVDAQSNKHSALQLRTIILGGEALNVALLNPWFERHGDATPEVYNMYGITETTVHVTYQRIQKDTSKTSNSVGMPLPGQHILILDAFLENVAVGVTGEIVVTGRRLANGYLNNPALTESRFITNTTASGITQRYYLSGDLGKMRADGQIEYIGRGDNQVKIRGYRIELGEIESTLCSQSGVAEAHVLACGEQEHKRLFAYVVLNEPKPTTANLLANLKAALPSYMVPSSIHILSAFPLTPNGKIDKQALLQLENADSSQTIAEDEPSTDVKESVSMSWSQLLRVQEINETDNFFDLGGHSLLAFEFIHKAQKDFSVKISMLDLLSKNLTEISEQIHVHFSPNRAVSAGQHA